MVPHALDVLGLTPEQVMPYGDGVWKLRPEVAFVPEGAELPGKLVLVSAVTPTPAGEGKTTVSIALVDGLARRSVRAVAALRQPSLGPTLGSKGGGAGGGKARLEPFERVNLGLSGDIHAVTSAHNLLAAVVDNALHFGSKDPRKALDPRRIDLPRVLDLDDRSLRHVITGLGGTLHGVPRETRFDITAASEVMAVLSLARDFADLKLRLGRIRVGASVDGEPVTAGDLRAAGGMAVVLRDALLPNVVCTAEGTPAFVHGGPFGNIAHGCSSIAATRAALSRAEVVVTEAGFGFDLGGEKFLDIKCRLAGLFPHAVVLVATLKALKMHGGVAQKDASRPNRPALELGAENLRHQVATVRAFGIDPVVAINVFPGDGPEELAVLEGIASEIGCPSARVDSYERGAEGGVALADVVRDKLEKAPSHPTRRFLYELDRPIEEKVGRIARTVYGATAVTYTPAAERDIERAKATGIAGLPICMAKTHLSLSADPKGGGRPVPHVLPVQALRASTGAGFLVALCGDIMTMPGLGREPAVLSMDLLDSGEIVGLR